MVADVVRIFLSGPMGSGKSTVARVVGQRTGLRVRDLDAEIEAQSGVSVAEIFASRGEAHFRQLEAEAVHELLADAGGCVVALGGGTVTDAESRRLLLRSGTLVTLRGDPSALAARVGEGTGRPLLAGADPERALAALLKARAAAYAEAHGCIDTTGLAPDEVAAEVLRIAEERPLVVALGERSYRVEIGPGVRERVGRRVASVVTSERVLVATDDNVAPHWLADARASLEAAGLEPVVVVLEAGEQHKRLAAVEQLWHAALSAGVDRGGAVVGLGGGVVGDLAGFAAATLFRGVPIVHVPTTLLSMVDSAVGGKTGFDTEHGKNLVGAFHQPSAVLCDIDTLRTLPSREVSAGLSEVVKSAWIDSEGSLAALERDAVALRALEPDALVRTVRMAASMKARVVNEDEREAGLRVVLNLGHTLGHAIEAAAGYGTLLHGEAVALGMVAALRVAVGLGRCDPAQIPRLVALLGEFGLPTDLEPQLGDATMAFLGADKKRRGRRITFALPEQPGRVTPTPLDVAEIIRLVRAGGES